MAREGYGTFSRASSVAAVSLSTSQFYAVTETSTGINVSNAGANMDGILLDNPASGAIGDYAFDGYTKAAISASQALTKGTTLLEVDTGGTLKVHASGTVVAKAMETLSSTANVMIITVKILRSNASF
jgi:hypothetical protein